jgi:putative salt-induced outer membrane protein
MTDVRLWASAAAAALLAALAPAAQAQNAGVNFDAPDVVADTVSDIEDDFEDDFDRDLDPFGNEGRELGFQGSVALRATATTGNSETSTLGIGTRLGYFDGLNGSELNFAYTRNDDGNSGDDVEENLFFGYDYTRELGRDLYGFAQGVAIYDQTEADPEGEDGDDAAFRSDVFVGAGLGYRIANSDRLQWSVQAGAGYRWYEPFGEERFEETALTASSNVLYRVSPTVTITDDATVIASENNTSVINDLALAVALNESLSLRTSLLTEYNSDPGFNMDFNEREKVDNTLGVAIVYNF